jgi:hypothetical protein
MEFKVGDRVKTTAVRRYGVVVGEKEIVCGREWQEVLLDGDTITCQILTNEIEIVDENDKTKQEQKIEELEQRIEKLEKEVFKPLTIKDGIKKSLEENLEISLKPSLLTEDERVILRNLNKRYKWIARDIDEDLQIFAKKPQKGLSDWWVEDSITFESLFMFTHLFQFITFEDKEPYNIEELLKGESEE